MSARKLPWIEIGILLLAVVLRVVLLDIKPPHFDEGVNGWFADQMTRQGFFRYDPTNYHGPLHFYAVFVSQTLFGRNLWALRLPVIIAGLLAVWALLRFREFFGPVTVRIAALAMAVSPACVFYGRYSIHESWLMFFQITFLWGVLGMWQKGERRFFFATVFAAVGMILTKETYVLHIGSFALTALVLWLWQKVVPSRPGFALAKAAWTGRDVAWASGIGVVAIVFFYSGNFLDFTILKGLYQTFGAWFHTGVEAAGHEKTTYALWEGSHLNYYWIRLFWIYEWPALLGLAACLRYVAPSDARLRYIAIYAGGVLLAYSLIPYKTPWCILSIIWPFFLLLGAVVEEVSKFVPKSRNFHPVPVFAAAGIFLSLVPCLRLNFVEFDNPKEPYVYVQTFRDSKILTEPLLGMARRDPRNYHVRGLLLLDSYYPLPWVFGDFTQLGYYKPTEIPESPITNDFVVAEKKDEARVEKKLSGDYFKRDFRLRDAQGDCVVYFRATTYGEWFKEDWARSFGEPNSLEETPAP